MKIVRYADDFVVMLAGQRADAEALRGEVTAVLAPMGLRLSDAKTRICHIDERDGPDTIIRAMSRVFRSNPR